ncbi:MAG TPA: hypothetical protein VGE54_06050 [Brevundimonas sp.]
MWILKAALAASLCLLTSCATPSSPAKPLPSECVPVERAPPLPDGAGLVAPATDQERSATRLFLTWVAEIVRIGDANAARAEDGRRACSS